LLGYLVGLVITKLTVPFFTESVGVEVIFNPVMAGLVLAVAVLLGLVASAYPALLAGNLDPNQALRSL
jgi:putative ABC transport system permease protein